MCNPRRFPAGIALGERRMNLKWKWRILRFSVFALTVLAFVGAFLRMKWVVGLAVALLIPWIVLEMRWWRCPGCGAFLGTMEKKHNCPHCGEKLEWK